MVRVRDDRLLLGEWACLGLIAPAPTHGFAVAARLKPDRDVGRIWSLSRGLTYRAVDQLVRRGFVESVGEEPGIAGGNRTIVQATSAGRAALADWLDTPVAHLRDLRSELLLKLTLGEVNGHDPGLLLAGQRSMIVGLVNSFDALDPAADSAAGAAVVALWRVESAHAALRFVDQLLQRVAARSPSPGDRATC